MNKDTDVAVMVSVTTQQHKKAWILPAWLHSMDLQRNNAQETRCLRIHLEIMAQTCMLPPSCICPESAEPDLCAPWRQMGAGESLEHQVVAVPTTRQSKSSTWYIFLCTRASAEAPKQNKMSKCLRKRPTNICVPLP